MAFCCPLVCPLHVLSTSSLRPLHVLSRRTRITLLCTASLALDAVQAVCEGLLPIFPAFLLAERPEELGGVAVNDTASCFGERYSSEVSVTLISIDCPSKHEAEVCRRVWIVLEQLKRCPVPDEHVRTACHYILGFFICNQQRDQRNIGL